MDRWQIPSSREGFLWSCEMSEDRQTGLKKLNLSSTTDICLDGGRFFLHRWRICSRSGAPSCRFLPWMVLVLRKPDSPWHLNPIISHGTHWYKVEIMPDELDEADDYDRKPAPPSISEDYWVQPVCRPENGQSGKTLVCAPSLEAFDCPNDL